MKFGFRRHESAHCVMSQSYQGTISITYHCTKVAHAHQSYIYRHQSLRTEHEDVHVFIIIYTFLFTSGTPFCTPHRHPREHSSNRLLHMLTDSTIPNLLWRLDTVCMRRVWGAASRVPGMGCPQPRPGIVWLAQPRFGAVHLSARSG